MSASPMSSLAAAGAVMLAACGGSAHPAAAPAQSRPPPLADARLRPPPPVARGTYQLISTFGVTAEAPLPGTAMEGLTTLRGFSTAPGHTLLALADTLGVPAVETLRKALPTSLERRIESRLDAEIAKATLDGVPVTEVAGDLAALGARVLTRFAIESTLTLGQGRASHRLAFLDLSPAGIAQRVPLGTLPGDVISATADATADADGTLGLGDHGFALAYGAYAWRALEAEFTARHGGAIRPTLGAAVGCAQIATRVAGTCRAGVCIGHAAELTQICERGLDEVIERARAKFLAYHLDALHLAAGTATPIDADADGAATGMATGVWTAEINASQGLRRVPATFTATR